MPAIEAAFSRATRVTLAGSITPAARRFSYFVGAGVVAEVGATVLHFLHYHGSSTLGVGHDLAQWLLDGALHDEYAGGFVVVVALETLKRGDAADVGHASARNDTLGDGGAGGAQGVVHTVFLLLHLHFGGCADMEHCHPPRELGQTFLKLSRS